MKNLDITQKLNHYFVFTNGIMTKMLELLEMNTMIQVRLVKLIGTNYTVASSCSVLIISVIEKIIGKFEIYSDYSHFYNCFNRMASNNINTSWNCSSKCVAIHLCRILLLSLPFFISLLRCNNIALKWIILLLIYFIYNRFIIDRKPEIFFR